MKAQYSTKSYAVTTGKWEVWHHSKVRNKSTSEHTVEWKGCILLGQNKEYKEISFIATKHFGC